MWKPITMLFLSLALLDAAFLVHVPDWRIVGLVTGLQVPALYAGFWCGKWHSLRELGRDILQAKAMLGALEILTRTAQSERDNQEDGAP